MTAVAGRAPAPPGPSTTARTPLWRDVRVLRVLVQIVVVVGVAGFLYYLYGNLVTNLRATGLSPGYGFLRQPYGVDIPGSDFRPGQSVRDALAVGFANTLRVAGVGILLATLIGIVVGVGRLSTNLLVRRSAALYVETLRNIPVFLIIFFMFTVVIQGSLPPITEAVEFLGITVFSNRGLYIPFLEAYANVGVFAAVSGLGLAAAIAVMTWRTRRSDATGERHHRVLWGLGVLVAVVALGYLALDQPVGLTVPSREGRAVTGGLEVNPSYAALLIGLVVYTASHIAEVVRGSIQSVPKGQTEAATAIGLTGFQRLRHVILPQAFRVMIPPLANQYLNLTKNSSLAVAIGYFEITRVTTSVIGNAAPAPQGFSILMLLYLTLSLGISLVANLVNRRLRLGTR